MTLIRPPLDYTAKDFDSIRARIFNVIPSAFPEWTDTQVANFGNILVESFAYVMDVLLFYQDNQANESRWSTARLRRSLLSLAKLIDFKPTGQAASHVTLTIQLTASPLGSVAIVVGDRFSTTDGANPVIFQAITAATISAGMSPPVAFVDAENSTAVIDRFISNGVPSQQFVLVTVPFLEQSLVITADDGTYTIVDDFLSSSATDLHVVVTVDENNRASIRFGDSISGTIPSGTIVCAYRSGGGVVGNVSQGTVTRAMRSYVDSLNNPVVLKVSNVSRAAGGAERQTIESMREAAPRSLRALSRTICREDYEINALRLPGVARALMLTRDEVPGIPENQGTLYIVPAGGGVATETLMSAVFQNLTVKYPKGITFKLAVLSASYLTVDISTRIHLARGANGSVVAAAIRSNLIAFLAVSAPDGSRNDNIDFGYYMDGALAWSDVFNIVRDTTGVRKIDDGLGNLSINGDSDDLVVPLAKFPLLGTIVVIDAATGAAL